MAANEVQQTLLNQDVALDSYLSKLLDDIPSDAELDTEEESIQTELSSLMCSQLVSQNHKIYAGRPLRKKDLGVWNSHRSITPNRKR